LLAELGLIQLGEQTLQVLLSTALHNIVKRHRRYDAILFGDFTPQGAELFRNSPVLGCDRSDHARDPDYGQGKCFHGASTTVERGW
jgi:hypothetical protein